MPNALRKARNDVAGMGTTEAEILEIQPDAKLLFDQIQVLKAKMYEAQKQAQQQAAEPFLAEIEELEIEYAMFLKLSA